MHNTKSILLGMLKIKTTINVLTVTEYFTSIERNGYI